MQTSAQQHNICQCRLQTGTMLISIGTIGLPGWAPPPRGPPRCASGATLRPFLGPHPPNLLGGR
eukprot:8094001-Alexandrium_andersonii.AAC.1